jgi:DegV family protein with EDD domain
MSIVIATDTTSGLTPQEAKELGVALLPMPVTIDGQEYLETVTLDRDFFFRKQAEGAEITTSQPAPGVLTEFWDRLLEQHDSVLYLPMTSGLSSSYATAATLAEDYDGRVEVVDAKRIAPPLWQMVQDALLLVRKGLSAAQCRQRLEEKALCSSIYLTPLTLEYLKKGGRVTPAAAAIGTVLNIKPVLQIQGGGVDAFAKVRGMKQAVEKMFAALDHDLATRFAGKLVRVFAAYSGDPSVGENWRLQMVEHYGQRFVRIDPLALNICCHTGPGTIALGCAEYEV